MECRKILGKIRLIDVHCHLDREFFGKDINEVIERCRKNNCIAIASGITPETNRNALNLKKKFPGLVYASLGLYPIDALKKETEESKAINLDYDIDKELKFIEKNKGNIAAIGEVGMDFKNGSDAISQEKMFRKAIELAIKLDKPLVVHSRKAEKEVIDILEEYNYGKIVMHCFSGKHSLAKRIRKNRWLFSIPTNIVRDESFQKIVKETPISQLLTETDSPFLSPFKGERNEPVNVIETIKKISEIKSLPIEDAANIIYRNAMRLFSLS